MRSAILALVPVMLSATTLSAQGVFSNKTQTVLEEVIRDYPNHFSDIKGELIGQASQTSCYKSTLELPGASSTTITLVAASGTQGSGWTCNVLRTADFDQAKARFSEIYNQLSNSIISAAGQRTFILSGQYETPTPDKKENEVVLTLLPGVGDMKRLRVELTLREDAQDYIVTISVNDGDLRDQQAQLAVNGR
ncbi:hypothetical protein [Puia dinghuensis]|uniref:Outer membrane lipoprotein carrier protein LolA n=1 Tax=Puia dinghuensis TaxID=1792502 RepID=A0A8J2UFF3_9BACT|nr:hypothetical protein [Puia dinghuensis]GGB10293.1 hypothetical protein GCM10011511_37340 [Puia dinghuensis]